MAGDWIEWSKGLTKKREVVLLAGRLGINEFEVAGRLMVLWEWCDENIPESHFEKNDGSPSVILGPNARPFLDALLGLPGFSDALASPDVAWIQFRSAGRVTFQNLGRHNGRTAKTRAVGRRKKRRQRVPDASAGSECPVSNGTKPGLQNRPVGRLVRGESEEIKFRCLTQVETSHLSSVGAMCGLHRRLHDEHPDRISNDEPALLNVIGAAERSMKRGGAGFFVGIVRKLTWNYINGDERAAAVRKLKEHRSWIDQERAAGREVKESMVPICDVTER